MCVLGEGDQPRRGQGGGEEGAGHEGETGAADHHGVGDRGEERLHPARPHAQAGRPLHLAVAETLLLPLPQQTRVAGRLRRRLRL